MKTLSAFVISIFLSVTNIFAASLTAEYDSRGVNIEYNSDFEVNTPYIVVDQISLEGNRITKPYIIYRELLFKSGDTLSVVEFESLLSGSRENLLNTALFNFVEINAESSSSQLFKINIVFVERWYVWPFPTLDIHERMVNTWLENPNFSRFSYGFYMLVENFRGRMERLRFNFRFGYNERLSFSYTIPYLNYNQTFGLTISSGYIRTREVNYISLNNRQLFYNDPMNYPREEFFAQVNFTYRKNFYHTHYLYLRYNHLEYADTLLALNPNFINSSDPQLQYFRIKYEFISDFRDIKAYPLKGYFNKLAITQNGLNTFRNDISPMFTIENSFRKYWDLDKNWYLAAGLNTKASFADKHPYFLQQGLGYNDDFVRGYEYYVVDAQHFAVLKTNFKYNIVPQRTKRLSFIPGDRFGLLHYAIFVNLFADAGYTYDNIFFENNPYTNSFIAGSGLGIDFVTYYDKVFRTEFTVNGHNEFGVYFHLIAPI